MLISTTKGLIEEKLMVKKSGMVNNDNEKTSWVEYWLNDELVHRSVNIEIKQPPTMQQSTGSVN